MKTFDNEKSSQGCYSITIWEEYALGLRTSLN